MTESHQQIQERTQNWIEKAVIGLNLCPFAKSVYVKDQIRYTVSRAQDLEGLAQELEAELLHLVHTSAEVTDTSLLIHPQLLLDFLDFNDFLAVADALLSSIGLVGQIQIANFHPDFQFADSKPQDIENYTNRAPYPILHLLRETSVESALQNLSDPDEIYQRNKETLRRLGHKGWNRFNF